MCASVIVLGSFIGPLQLQANASGCVLNHFNQEVVVQ